jgi:glycosyltransferase involved in cell wall biosynthesis
MTDVAVLIPTYNRAEILDQTIEALRKNLKGAELTFFVGNDHTDPVFSMDSDVIIFNDPSGSFGANLNRLIKAAVNGGFDYLFQLDDDHLLLEELDLWPHICALREGDGIGWVRLMGVGSHGYRATLVGDYWMIDWDSHGELYITSCRPHQPRS